VVCRALALPRSTKRYKPLKRDDEDELTAAITYLASNYGCYGYRRITAMLHKKGFEVNHKRVERIWREQGLKVARK
jgi:putative transposase